MTLRDLTTEECFHVSGCGEDTVTFYDNDRDGKLSVGDKILYYTVDGYNLTPKEYSETIWVFAGASSNDSSFTQLGYGYFGVGAGLSFHDNGDVGIWAGLGFDTGVIYTQGEYTDGTQEGMNISWTPLPSITWDTGNIMADSEPYVWNEQTEQYELQAN